MGESFFFLVNQTCLIFHSIIKSTLTWTGILGLRCTQFIQRSQIFIANLKKNPFLDWNSNNVKLHSFLGGRWMENRSVFLFDFHLEMIMAFDFISIFIEKYYGTSTERRAQADINIAIICEFVSCALVAIPKCNNKIVEMYIFVCGFSAQKLCIQIGLMVYAFLYSHYHFKIQTDCIVWFSPFSIASLLCCISS